MPPNPPRGSHLRSQGLSSYRLLGRARRDPGHVSSRIWKITIQLLKGGAPALQFFYFWLGRYNKTLNDWPRVKQWVLFPLDLIVSGLGEKTHCFPRGQSLSACRECRCLSCNQPCFNVILADQIFHRFYVKLVFLFSPVLWIHQGELVGGKTPSFARCFGCVEDSLKRSYESI